MKYILTFSFYLTASYWTFSQCNFSLSELLSIGQMNGSEIDDLTILKGMSYDTSEEGYSCDDESGVLFINNRTDEFSYIFSTTSKKQYQSWKSSVQNNDLFEYRGEQVAEGIKLLIYKYLKILEDPLVVAVSVVFSQQIIDEGQWAGTVKISYYY
jgi:hypothetical protein